MSAAGLVLAAVGIFSLHCYSYFFVFDDFALIGDSADYSARSIVTNPLFGFYRPVAFLVTKAQVAVAHWSAPWVYAAASILVHCVNALLVMVYSRRLGLRRAHAQLAALLFLLSPWASETYFWVSGRFDLLATLGILTTVVAALWGTSGPSLARLAAAGLFAFAGTAFAVFSKESAVIAPALVAGTLCAARNEGTRGWRRQVVPVGASIFAVAVYLLVRYRLALALDGAYGSYPDLLARSALDTNAWTFARRLVYIPFPPLGTGAWSNHASALVIAALAFVTTVNAVRREPRAVALAIVAVPVSLLPVIWLGLPASGSGGGRFLYTPGVWFCMVLGSVAGIETAWRRIGVHVVAACAMVTMFASVVYGALIWRQASVLSRVTIEQLEPYRTSGGKLFIANMPFWYRDGPYVAKDYAFSRYFAPTPTSVRGRAMELVYSTDAARFTKWVPQYGELVPAIDEQVVFLELPVSDMPLVPAPPHALEADVRERVVKLRWKRGVGGGQPAGFAIEASLDPDFRTLAATMKSPDDVTERLVQAVPPNRYFVRVVAFNAHGDSQPSPAICVVVE